MSTPRATKKSYDLSEAEQRDLVTLIQQGKSLPEKYRFILFEDKREVELVWNGKTRDVCTTVLPFQTLEHVDEPRTETKAQQDLFDSRGRQLRGWTNKLIWGDNKLILSSLKTGALRQQIDEAGGIKLIYIDPPFDVGADFSMDIEIGGETFHKEANLLEQIAYRDTWGRGADSFIAMLYERLLLMRDLLAEDGSMYVHCDPRVNAFIRLALNEVFGVDRFRNEIVWQRTTSRKGINQLGRVHDLIYFYSKEETVIWNAPSSPQTEESARGHDFVKDPNGTIHRLSDLTGAGTGPPRSFNGIEIAPSHGRHWAYDQAGIDDLMARGRISLSKNGNPRLKTPLRELEEWHYTTSGRTRRRSTQPPGKGLITQLRSRRLWSSA
jgi:site-specific DNA-methyltransferase (adenine-specific)/adenine-specific DNA-methyltransferase